MSDVFEPCDPGKESPCGPRCIGCAIYGECDFAIDDCSQCRPRKRKKCQAAAEDED